MELKLWILYIFVVFYPCLKCVNSQINQGIPFFNGFVSRLEKFNDVLQRNMKKFDIKVNKNDIHPFLYFENKDLQKLRRDCLGTHKNIFTKLERGVKYIMRNEKIFLPSRNKSNWHNDYGNYITDISFYVLLKPQKKNIDFAKKYLHYMYEIVYWKLDGKPINEFKLAKNVIGFTIAIDNLWSSLEESKRLLYTDRIFKTINSMNNVMEKSNWGYGTLQSSSTTKIFSVFIACLMLESFKPKVNSLRLNSMKRIEYTIKLLEGVIDGSNSESAASNFAFSNCITNYVFLQKRHFSYTYNLHNAWLSNHYEFIYDVILPSKAGLLGISNPSISWQNGPESQLVFLDSFVIKRGFSNWLADIIRKERLKNQRIPLIVGTIFTEYLWYNASIPNKKPKYYDSVRLKLYFDWGVVVYRSDKSFDKASEFVSFQSFPLQSHLLTHLSNTPKFMLWNDWRKHRPVIEHSNQNSFSIFMNNINMISPGGISGKKSTQFDNAPLFKYAGKGKLYASEASCNHPWVGQRGDCGSWSALRYQDLKPMDAFVVSFQNVKKYTFISGEAGGSYPKALGVKNFYRSLLILHKYLIIVMDYINLANIRNIPYFSTFLNNYENQFENAFYHGFNGLKIKDRDDMGFFWQADDQRSPKPILQTKRSYYNSKKLSTNVNITFQVRKNKNFILYGFLGPQASVKKSSIEIRGDIAYVRILSNVGNFTVYLPLNYTSSSLYCRVLRNNMNAVDFSKSRTKKSEKKVSKRPPSATQQTANENLDEQLLIKPIGKLNYALGQKQKSTPIPLPKREIVEKKCSRLRQYMKLLILICSIIFFTEFGFKFHRRRGLFYLRLIVLIITIIVSFYLLSEKPSCLLRMIIF